MSIMSDKGRNVGINKAHPIPMKLFAAWEVDRTPPYCIPRLCTVTVSRLALFQPMSSDLKSVVICVKMQSSKRTLRSNEIAFTPGMYETDLDLTFSLQYPHLIKREGNVLVVLMQRRKRYKNRAILGYKTLAEGTINMAQVLQCPQDMDLELIYEPKEKDKANSHAAVAKVTMVNVSSQPVDQEEIVPHPTSHKDMMDNTGRVGEFSEDEDDYSSEDGSDSEPTADMKTKVIASSSISSVYGSAQQRNLKQKFIALLKRFKVSDDFESREAIESKLTRNMDAAAIEDLFSELDDLSDSGPEIDSISISSTPKPSLRPFFASCKSLVNQNQDSPPDNIEYGCNDENSRTADSDSLPGVEDTQPTLSPSSSCTKINEKLYSKAVLEQLSQVFPPEDAVPDHVIMISAFDNHGSSLAAWLKDRKQQVIITRGSADIKATFSCIVGRIQKFCNSNAKAPSAIKVLIIGSDSYVNSIVCVYVDHLSSKAPDWQSYIKFFIVPLGQNSLCRYLGSIDSAYNSLFLTDGWKDLTEKGSNLDELIGRLCRYLNASSSVIHVPIAEAMVMYKDRGSDEESTQIFVPFISEVRIGVPEAGTVNSLSVEMDENSLQSGSPPSHSLTPPSSPSANSTRNETEPLELQLDYWSCAGSTGTPLTTGQGITSSMKTKLGESVGEKSSMKAVFRSVQALRLPQQGEPPAQYLTLAYVLKEKKQKIMRLGKKKEKEKENEPKSLAVNSVTRLICLGKMPSMPLKVYIDGSEWNGVKFFQLSSQWQTHVKYFPVVLFSYAENAIM